MNYKTIFNIIGRVLLLEAALMLLPLGVSAIYSDGCTDDLLIGAAAAAALGAVMFLPTRKAGKPLSVRDSLAVAALTWLFASLAGCLPFITSGEIPYFPDAFFETVSGFTTTGASILTDVEHMSRGLLFWRSFTHWLGGMGILVLVTAIAAGRGDGSTNILKAEMPGHSLDKFTPKAKNNAKLLYGIYIVLTLLETVLLIAGGMPVFDSVVHALGTAGTGGFGIKADSIASYSAYLQWVITVFMLLFGVSFNIYCLMLVRRWREALRSNELRCYLGIFAAATVIVCINIYPMYGSVSDVIRLSSFQTASIITTTGYATADFNAWPQLSKAVLFILMFCGGCMGSTAGGLKISRITVLAQVCANELRRSINPRSVNSVKLNGSVLTSEQEQRVLSYLALYIAVIAVTFILISINGLGLEEDISAVVACVNNIGPGFGLIGPAGSYAAYSGFAKMVLSVAMLIGRLEIYPLLALLMLGSRR
ncbi:MAG: TrkH family potassium uptake protein [Oscillospiraceae bacterium]